MCDNMGLWQKCVFEGPPPHPFKSWTEWAVSDNNSHVTIRARQKRIMLEEKEAEDEP